jgi:hypothetical protein
MIIEGEIDFFSPILEKFKLSKLNSEALTILYKTKSSSFSNCSISSSLFKGTEISSKFSEGNAFLICSVIAVSIPINKIRIFFSLQNIFQFKRISFLFPK